MEIENQAFLRSSELFRTLWRVNLSMRRIVQKSAADNNLSVPQYAVLMTLTPRKEMTQKQLGTVMQFPKSTLSQAVDGLVQAGLINRHPVKENRREMQLIVSEKGKMLYETIKRKEGSIHHAFESAIDTLSVKQYDELLCSLRQIASFLENESEENGESKHD
ncbi:MarR family transcriptional regulator [Bacillus sp. FJAT-49705]|uniref:MarR family transcriptional regulator n=1 Tax=Cytobacillus citreus TaxID=2833586 RepID=A0ABS5NS38_9BACI|nr:MarR family transcriptional regulator [Cytobacillus citreus]MBS4190625.1 MarR family transcriptional regulator [Cytobacillus citreus]